MSWKWLRETTARWDADKARIVGQCEPGIFDNRYRQLRPGDLVPAEWWRVEDGGGRVVGYGWLDANWGDAEILLAVEPASASSGVGSFILAQLHVEAAQQGLNYLTNVVRPTHPRAAVVTAWLQRRGFGPSDDGRLQARVRPSPQKL